MQELYGCFHTRPGEEFYTEHGKTCLALVYEVTAECSKNVPVMVMLLNFLKPDYLMEGAFQRHRRLIWNKNYQKACRTVNKRSERNLYGQVRIFR